MIILSSDDSLQENIKRNALNYVFHGEDRITMRLFPSKSLQLIFHCGIKGNKSNTIKNLIDDSKQLLLLKTDDMVLIELTTIDNLDSYREQLVYLIRQRLQHCQ